MTTDEITRTMVLECIEETAKEIVEECEDRDTAMDRVWETVDSFNWVIYTYKAREVVHTLDGNDEGEAFDRLSEFGLKFGEGEGVISMGDLYTKLAFCYLENAISFRVQELFDERDD